MGNILKEGGGTHSSGGYMVGVINFELVVFGV